MDTPPTAGVPRPPVPGTDADARRVSGLRWAVVARAILALAIWTALTELSLWLAAFTVLGPVVAFGVMPSARRVRENVVRSAVEVGAAGFLLFRASCLGALAGGVLLVWGFATQTRDGWVAAILLFAFLFVDRALLRVSRNVLRHAMPVAPVPPKPQPPKSP